MSPNMAQGAGMAADDALVLAETVAAGRPLNLAQRNSTEPYGEHFPLWPLTRRDSTARSGAEEGEDGQHPAMLVRRLGQVELLEDLGDVGLHGALGGVQPGGDGPVGHALGDQPQDLSFPLAEDGQRVLPAASP